MNNNESKNQPKILEFAPLPKHSEVDFYSMYSQLDRNTSNTKCNYYIQSDTNHRIYILILDNKYDQKFYDQIHNRLTQLFVKEKYDESTYTVEGLSDSHSRMMYLTGVLPDLIVKAREKIDDEFNIKYINATSNKVFAKLSQIPDKKIGTFRNIIYKKYSK